MSSPRRRGSSGVQELRDEPATVLPAQAGVFQAPGAAERPSPSPPRAGGGLPRARSTSAISPGSSPRRRGSSRFAGSPKAFRRVLPAQAGVFPAPSAPARSPPRPPRAGGGLPSPAKVQRTGIGSSPRRRGSSGPTPHWEAADAVLPAQAGVFRRSPDRLSSSGRPPRAGGGLPAGVAAALADRESSPRRRGSSELIRTVADPKHVLPAQAGVFLAGSVRPGVCQGPPRAGGGLPPYSASARIATRSSPRRRGSFPPHNQGKTAAATSSPRRRGSSAAGGQVRGELGVLPAQAGVFLGVCLHPAQLPRPPRAGGGLPRASDGDHGTSLSSPRRRGSSGARAGAAVPPRVLPSQAGVFLPRRPRGAGEDCPPLAGGGLATYVLRVLDDGRSSPRRRGSSVPVA